MAIHDTEKITVAISLASSMALSRRNEFLTPEHLLAAFLKDDDIRAAADACGVADHMESLLNQYLDQLEQMPDGNFELNASSQLQELIAIAENAARGSGSPIMKTHHVMYAFFQLEDSHARYALEDGLEVTVPAFLNEIVKIESEDGIEEGLPAEIKWTRFFRECVAEDIVGRENETREALRILCRKRKNNILIVGGRGVGKTAFVHGLAKTFQNGDVPAKLKDFTIKELMPNMVLSGAQYRGDLEGRIEDIVKGLAEDGKTIMYVDELRSLGGYSKTDDGMKDIIGLLTPYLKDSSLKLIIGATYEDVKRLQANDSNALDLFRKIELEEPSEAETGKILENIMNSLCEHYGIGYDEGTASYAVGMSRRYILDRCLPDKAIDLLDEAGAYAMTAKEGKVTKRIIGKALADICKTDVQAYDEDVKDDLYHMEERLKGRIYGQDEAIRTVTEAILMSKAGLTDAGKTIGSFLFVGPTGVGKTELSKVLAQQLHVPLHRFDMSEYSEKHSVAKLIGSPAGYVGYDDGGILTETIRKNPYCILLLDEIEKAHEDIYNLLLQVMDYAVISDNKGRKVDFRNVVIIMTSNAGARYAHQASIGFERKVSAGTAMAKEVKKVFAPEFLNRLSSVVVFNDMDEKMAGMILDDKINGLKQRLDSRNVSLVIEPEAYSKLLKEGFSPEYGAREIERVLNSRLTPMLMREILFGNHKEGFTAIITATEDGYDIRSEQK
ncbi:MAG: AAA family ATPase [Bacteroidales bacterium]|nr:AAA family ATPase [Bacteroidales bacterium]